MDFYKIGGKYICASSLSYDLSGGAPLTVRVYPATSGLLYLGTYHTGVTIGRNFVLNADCNACSYSRCRDLGNW